MCVVGILFASRILGCIYCRQSCKAFIWYQFWESRCWKIKWMLSIFLLKNPIIDSSLSLRSQSVTWREVLQIHLRVSTFYILCWRSQTPKFSCSILLMQKTWVTLLPYHYLMQAMAAYRTAERLFPGLHLPLLGMGLEYHRMSNLPLAEQLLRQAHAICPIDPLVCNELGVLAFRNLKYPEAEKWFNKALDQLPDSIPTGKNPMTLKCSEWNDTIYK